MFSDQPSGITSPGMSIRRDRKSLGERLSDDRDIIVGAGIVLVTVVEYFVVVLVLVLTDVIEGMMVGDENIVTGVVLSGCVIVCLVTEEEELPPP